MPTNKPSPWEFVLAFRRETFGAMSGGVSVPFAALAVFLDNAYAQAIFAAMAFTAVWFAAYRVWKAERERTIVAENQINEIANRVANTLVVTGEVHMNDATGNLEWGLKLLNTSDQPIGYGEVAIIARIDGGEFIPKRGSAGIVRADRSATFTYPFAAPYEGRDGGMTIAVDFEYGVAGRTPSRHIVQTVSVPFQRRGAATYFRSHSTAFRETEIIRPQQSVAT